MLERWADLEDAVAVVNAVWGDVGGLVSPALLRTYAHYGNPVIGAFDGDLLCGVSIGFLASSPVVHLHSHITGVLPSHQHLGLGYELKSTQRQWCIDRGIDLVTWTFDPMLARNAHFNLRKLGAVARRILPSFYGVMDDDINRGDDTDRLEISWHLPASDADDRPEVVRTVAIPDDYLALRAEDAVQAGAWRADVREQLLAAFADGLEIIDFDRNDGYLLARCSERNRSAAV
jgi:predicted GNAT superfamily acetyltransferase